MLDAGTGSAGWRWRWRRAAAPSSAVDRDARAIDEARGRPPPPSSRNVRVRGRRRRRSKSTCRSGPDAVVAYSVHVRRDRRAGEPRASCRPGLGASSPCTTTSGRRRAGRSRFAYGETGVRRLLKRTGFHGRVTSRSSATSKPSRRSRKAWRRRVGLQERWKVDGRWFKYVKFLEDGGRTLTRAQLVVKARKA